VPNFEILLTSFEVLAKDRAELARVAWNYIVVDEKHLKRTGMEC
jgi:SNF2 family DNA or RNA helicase